MPPSGGLIEPGPLVLVTTAQKKEYNIMTMSWHMMMEFTPLIGCIISSENYSFTAVRNTQECVIAIPTVEFGFQVVRSANIW